MYQINLIKLLALIAVYFLSIILINYYGDAGYLFSNSYSFESKLADALLNKNTVLVCNNYNDRSVKRLLLNNISKKPEVLIFGSSRTMTITNARFNNLNF